MARRERPLRQAVLRKRRPIRAKKPPPADAMTTVQNLFLKPGRGGEPSVKTRLVKEGTRYRVAIEVDDAMLESSPPRARRHIAKPKELRLARRRGRRGVVDGFRPGYLDQTWLPSRRGVRRRKAARVLHRRKKLDPLYVFDPDRRYTFKDNNYPWRTHGRVFVPGAISSGVLVGPRHLLTASHVINWGDLSISFTANQYDNFNAGSTYADWIFSYKKIGNVNTDNVEYDYVVCVLHDRLGDSLGWMGTREYYDDWDGDFYWGNMGYSGGDDRPSFQNLFTLHEEDGGDAMAMTSQNVDLDQGMSGGPIFGFWSQGPYVVAVVSAEGQGKNWAAGGESMVDLVKTARWMFP